MTPTTIMTKEDFAGLGFGRNLQTQPSVQSRHFQIATQRGRGETDRYIAI